jgi:pimeloyl-ACP methyl ester carboxylesterase
MLLSGQYGGAEDVPSPWPKEIVSGWSSNPSDAGSRWLSPSKSQMATDIGSTTLVFLQRRERRDHSSLAACDSLLLGSRRTHWPGSWRSQAGFRWERRRWLRARPGANQVVIYGHSWGSALGVLYAGRFPEKVVAYVGSGQIGDWAAGEAASYAFALAKATRLHDHKALKKLHLIGPPPHSAKSMWTERTCLQRIEGQLSPRALWKMGRVLFGGPESSILDLPNIMRGFRFSLDAMWAEVSTLDLVKRVPALQMPVFFFVGRRDHWVPPEVSVAYFDALAAPSKKLVWFEESGHEAFVDEPDKFNSAMVDLVRPTLPLTSSQPSRTNSPSPASNQQERR